MKYWLLLFLTPLWAQAQDIHFSQADMVPYQYSPALAGLFDGDIRGMAVERTQWRSVTTPYQPLELLQTHGTLGHPRAQV